MLHSRTRRQDALQMSLTIYLFPREGVKAAFQNLRQGYGLVGKPERFATYTFDGPHKFPERAQQLMLDWFDRWV